jgi:ATP-dependent Clp protease adaptor protein ClpS
MSERNQEKGDVLVRPKVDKPPRYKVLLFNDDFTTMEFVVWVLQSVFKLTSAESTRVMLIIHRSGVGVAGVYTQEIAETRVQQVLAAAREHGHPLQCTMEPE